MCKVLTFLSYFPVGQPWISSLPLSHRLDIPRVCPFNLSIFKAKLGLPSDINHKKCFCVCKIMCVNVWGFLVWNRKIELWSSPPRRGHVSWQVKGHLIWRLALTFRVGSSPGAELRQTCSSCSMAVPSSLCICCSLLSACHQVVLRRFYQML